MIKCYAILSKTALAAACLLLLLSPFFFFAGNNKALADFNIWIDSPRLGSTVYSASFEISVSYVDDEHDPPSPSNKWYIYFEGFTDKNEKWIDEKHEIFQYEGTLTITGSIVGFDSELFDLTAYLVPGPNAAGCSASTSFSIDLSNSVSTVPGGDSPAGSIPVAVPDGLPPDNPSSSGGAVVPIIVGGGAIAAGGLLVRGLVRRGSRKKVPKPPVRKGPEPGSIEEAAANLAEGRRNRALLDRYHKIRDIVWKDDRLLEFVDSNRGNIIGPDGRINGENLNRLEGTLKHWINRDTQGPGMQDYSYSDAYLDTVSQASRSIIIRGGMAYLTGGYSEMALNPIAAVSRMRDSINQGDSTAWAVGKGFAWSGFELALGESGRLVKYAKPLMDRTKDTFNQWRLSRVNEELAHDISNINQLAQQADDAARYSRDAFMKSTEVVKVGQTAAPALDHAEKLALELANNPEFRKLLAENSNLISSRVKDVMGLAKQKVYQSARDKAAAEVLEQMARDGVPAGQNPFFIRQTGTHAQPGNPGWNSLKSDFDHTVEFGSSKYNQLYEKQFEAHLKAQGTSATAIDANVYGAGTSARGAYSPGGAMKFVEHYNQTSGSDVMVRVTKDGATTISRETPQASTSLLSTMKQGDVQSATSNYQKFFLKDMAKGGSLDNQIMNGAKTVSRNAGGYSTKYVEHFQKTGSVKYTPPDAAKVADLIKKRGFTVDGAMQRVGYTGTKEQLLADFKQIMGAP